MQTGHYLRLRGGTYHFRARIPLPLCGIPGRSEIAVSLKTGRFASAMRAAREMRSGLDRIMVAVEQVSSHADIERRVRAWIARSAINYDARLSDNDGLTGVFTVAEAEMMGPEQTAEMDCLVRSIEMVDRERVRSMAVEAAAGLRPAQRADALMAVAAEELDLRFEAGSPEAKALRRAVLRNLPALMDAHDASDRGSPLPDQILAWLGDAPVSRPTPAPQPPAPPLRNGEKPIAELWSSFCDSKIGGNEWKPAEKVAARSTLKLWLDISGERAVDRYSVSDVEEFRKVFRGLPDNYYHNKRWRPIFETSGARSLYEQSKGADCPRVTPKTWNKHLSRLNEFWKWLASKGEALASDTPSIFAGFFIKVPKNRIGRRMKLELRRKFEEDEIKVLLSSPTFLGCRSQRDWKTKGDLVFRDHRYWITLIGFLHGMRREEPVLLRVKHVKLSKTGIWYFDLLDDGIVPLLKDIGSPRHVPLHKDLLALGFIEARVTGRAADDALFPEAVSLSEIGRNADPFGKWFLNFRRFHGVDDPKLDFHAVRHTVISRLLDAGVPENHVEELCGHEGEGRRSEIASYDHGRLLKILKDAIDRLVIPLDVPALNAAQNRSVVAWDFLNYRA